MVVIQTNVNNLVVTDDDELVDGLRNGQNVIHNSNVSLERTSSPFMGQIERRRRKLPEIPKNKKCLFSKLINLKPKKKKLIFFFQLQFFPYLDNNHHHLLMN